MGSFDIAVPCIIRRFAYHSQLKEQLLTLMANQNNEELRLIDDYHSNFIYRLDWNKHTDFTRPWVQLFLSEFSDYLGDVANTMGFDNIVLTAIWYQQYIKDSMHGWHTHGDNYTGVYYLELHEDSPATELIDNKNIMRLDVKEGDFVVFPSFIKHRAPKILDNNRKTIISFNFNLDMINSQFIGRIKDEQ
jgi:hypothetical protein